MTVRPIDERNYPEVAVIYQQGIDTKLATFETTAPDWQTWDKSHLPQSRIALYEDDQVIAWGALTAVSSRCVYAGVAEVSVYVRQDYRGRGTGEIVLNHLVRASETLGFWTLQSGIFEENIASQRIHKKCGFRMIGYRERIGKLDGVWKNNVIMERRSKTIGI